MNKYPILKVFIALLPAIVLLLVKVGCKKRINNSDPHSPTAYDEKETFPSFTVDTTVKDNNRSPFYGGPIATNHPRISKKYDPSLIESYYPFFIYNDGSFMIAAEVESDSLFDRYTKIFEKYDYSGSGIHWANLIIQIFEDKDSSFLKHIEFDPESGGFYAFADSKASQKKFVKTISPIFKNTQKLEEYLKQANRERMNR